MTCLHIHAVCVFYRFFHMYKFNVSSERLNREARLGRYSARRFTIAFLSGRLTVKTSDMFSRQGESSPIYHSHSFQQHHAFSSYSDRSRNQTGIASPSPMTHGHSVIEQEAHVVLLRKLSKVISTMLAESTPSKDETTLTLYRHSHAHFTFYCI